MDSTDIQRELFETFMESQYWPREQIEEYQRKRLQRLLRHARSHVPFYRDRLAGVVDDSGRVDWSQWDKIPILTRADLVSHGREIESTALPTGHGAIIRSATSGSTGVPLSVAMSVYANIASQAALHRGQSWHELDWSKDVLFYTEERPESGVWPSVEIGNAWGPPWMEAATGRFLRFNGDTPPPNILAYLAEHGRVAYLSCRAKVAQVLALESERLHEPAKLSAVFAFSTAAHDDEHEDIRRAFGAKVLSLYSSKEAHMMGYQCPHGDHLHINEEIVRIELLDEDGTPVPPGTIGRVVVTNLFNWAQPIIRYAQDDLAIEGERCVCGRTLRVLSKVIGRVTDMFRFPDGTSVAFALPENIKRELRIKSWQVAQVGPLEIEVRYAPDTGDGGIDESALATAVRRRSHPDIRVTFRRTTDFIPSDGGKFAEYINEFARGLRRDRASAG